MGFGAEITKVLDKLAEQFGMTIDWSQKNVLPFLQSLIEKYATYNIANCIVGTTIGFFLIVIPPFILHKIRKSYKEDEWFSGYDELTGEGLLNIIYIVICVIATIVGVIMFPIFLTSLIKWCCIPELATLESIYGLISSK